MLIKSVSTIVGQSIDSIKFNKSNEYKFNYNDIELYRIIKENEAEKSLQLKNLDSNTSNLPLTFSIVTNIINRKLCSLQSVTGSSAKNIISRFTTKNSLFDLAKKIVDIEKNSSDFKYVDLINVSNTSKLHLFTSSVFRSQNIEFMSTNQSKNNIKFEDLLVSVLYDKLYIYDKNDLRVVLPIIPNQYNIFLEKHPFKKFLKSYTNQFYKTDFDFSLKTMSILLDRTPRICYKNVILYPRTFLMKKKNDFNIEFENLIKWSYENENSLVSIKTNEHLEGSIISLKLNDSKSIIKKFFRKSNIIYIGEVPYDEHFESKYLYSSINQLILFGVNNE